MPGAGVITQAINQYQDTLLALGAAQFSPWMDFYTLPVAESIPLVPFLVDSQCLVFVGNKLQLSVRFDANYPVPANLQVILDEARVIAGVFTIQPTGIQFALAGPLVGNLYVFNLPAWTERFMRFRFIGVNAVFGQVDYTIRSEA